MAKLSDVVLQHVLQHQQQLDNAVQTSVCKLPAPKKPKDGVSRLKALALYTMTNFVLNDRSRGLATYRFMHAESSEVVLAALFYAESGQYKDNVYAVEFKVCKTASAGYATHTRVLPLAEWPDPLRTFAELPLQPIVEDVVLQKNGDSFREAITPKKRRLNGSINKTFTYTLQKPCGLLDLDPAKAAALANITATYRDRTCVAALCCIVNRAMHMWWQWSPKNWQGKGDKPLFLSFMHVVYTISFQHGLVTKMTFYCFDECDALRAYTCPPYFVDQTNSVSSLWRASLSRERIQASYTSVELLDVNELRAKP